MNRKLLILLLILIILLVSVYASKNPEYFYVQLNNTMTREEIDNIVLNDIIRIVNEDDSKDEIQRNIFITLLIKSYQHCTKDKNVQELIEYIEKGEGKKCLDDYILLNNTMIREEIDDLFKESIKKHFEDDNTIDEIQQMVFANLAFDSYLYW